MTTHRLGDLEFDTQQQGDQVEVILKGTADVRDGDALANAMLDIHRQALATNAKNIIVDVRQVEFMNSTALGAFVSWVALLQDQTASQRYHMCLRGTASRRWQRGSLNALASFAPDQIVVELA